MEELKKVVFFCSSYKDIDEKYNQAAREIVRAACQKGYVIVSGGTVKGTMKVVADTAYECGAENIGIIPRFMKGLENPKLSSIEWTDSMSERKEAMRKGTCLAIALPGGVGTMDELIETLTLAKLERYHGRILVLNLDGFYEPLKELLQHFLQTGMVDAHTLTLVAFPQTAEELISLL